MPSVDDVLRHAFEHADDDWARRAPEAHASLMARHHRGQLMRQAVVAGAAAAAAAAVAIIALRAGVDQAPRGVEPADPAPTTGTSAVTTPLEGRWTSSSLDAADVRAAARAAGAPKSAASMLDALPQAPFTVVLVVRGASLETFVEGADGAREVLDEESISVAGQLVTLRPVSVPAASVHEWSIDGDELDLAFRSTTENEIGGVPGEAWHRLLYDSTTFSR